MDYALERQAKVKDVLLDRGQHRIRQAFHSRKKLMDG